MGKPRNRLEDQRERMKALTEELVGVKEKRSDSEITEKREELLQEDARLTSTVGYAEHELRQHEWDLASTIGQGGGGQGQRVQ